MYEILKLILRVENEDEEFCEKFSRCSYREVKCKIKCAKDLRERGGKVLDFFGVEKYFKFSKKKSSEILNIKTLKIQFKSGIEPKVFTCFSYRIF